MTGQVKAAASAPNPCMVLSSTKVSLETSVAKPADVVCIEDLSSHPGPQPYPCARDGQLVPRWLPPAAQSSQADTRTEITATSRMVVRVRRGKRRASVVRQRRGFSAAAMSDRADQGYPSGSDPIPKEVELIRSLILAQDGRTQTLTGVVSVVFLDAGSWTLWDMVPTVCCSKRRAAASHVLCLCEVPHPVRGLCNGKWRREQASLFLIAMLWVQRRHLLSLRVVNVRGWEPQSLERRTAGSEKRRKGADYVQVL